MVGERDRRSGSTASAARTLQGHLPAGVSYITAGPPSIRTAGPEARVAVVRGPARFGSDRISGCATHNEGPQNKGFDCVPRHCWSLATTLHRAPPLHRIREPKRMAFGGRRVSVSPTVAGAVPWAPDTHTRGRSSHSLSRERERERERISSGKNYLGHDGQLT